MPTTPPPMGTEKMCIRDRIYLEFGADPHVEGVYTGEDIKEIRKNAIHAGPVSYTHLGGAAGSAPDHDTEKQPALHDRLFAPCAGRIGGADPVLGSGDPVHAPDVYKRQRRRSAPAGRARRWPRPADAGSPEYRTLPG